MAKYLKKQSVLDYLIEYLEALKRVKYDTTFHKAQRKALRTVIQDIQAMDSTEIMIRYGRWIDIHEYCKMNGYIPSGVAVYYWCSECMKEQEKTSDFCPNCGADMRELNE